MHVGHLVDTHAAPDAAGDERDRERAVRSGQRRGGERARCPQQHPAGEIVAEVIHLPDQRDRRAEDDRADADGQIGEMVALGAVEQRGHAVSPDNAGEQDGEAQRPRDRRPVGGDEGEEGGGDQQTADDADHGRDGDAFGHRPQRRADGVGGFRRQQAFGLPPRQIGLQPLPIGPFGHSIPPPLLSRGGILRQTGANGGNHDARSSPACRPPPPGRSGSGNSRWRRWRCAPAR